MTRICYAAFLSLENIYTCQEIDLIHKKLISGKGLCLIRLESSVLCWVHMCLKQNKLQIKIHDPGIFMGNNRTFFYSDLV